MLADSESNDSISFLVSGGINNEEYLSRSQILTTSISGKHPRNVAPLTWQGNPEQLLIEERFVQQQAFPVSSQLMTADFVRKHVRDEKKQAVLLDKKQPGSDLLVLAGLTGKLHIFDKTHRMWLACLDRIKKY